QRGAGGSDPAALIARPELAPDAAIAEIVDVFDLASFCQNARRRLCHSAAAAWLTRPRGALFFAGAGRSGITELKALEHWLEPCARRGATEANRPAGARAQRA
ncbi:MAG TPA: hypothetical protein VE909_08275, partial [Xanthobacteraceae bacterium]|nr:hypothetical protein [Xanthobacteraceae bacterium]